MDKKINLRHIIALCFPPPPHSTEFNHVYEAPIISQALYQELRKQMNKI